MKLIFSALLLASFAALAGDACMLDSESTKGDKKTCVYRCNGGEKSITIKSTSLCPLTL